MVGLDSIEKLEEDVMKWSGWIACTTKRIFLENPHFYETDIKSRRQTGAIRLGPELVVRVVPVKHLQTLAHTTYIQRPENLHRH
ncbi:unnamed protein product [Rhizoctonia solani]|uniref:Uncharacterized protein n=1 Tax=Rhizoctonia solani TaxID=456999 RepID=A0A8H3DWH8_9AGAM|nr:unnamed protein product [Rhizoctonia solani]